MKRTFKNLSAAAGFLLVAACDTSGNPVIVDPDPPAAPGHLEVAYAWVLEGFQNGQPMGYPAVDLHWLPPSPWNGETFRVYGRRAGTGGWTRIATVTSCTAAGCFYRDRNVSHGQDYEFYVAAFDERNGGETSTEFAELVRVPAAARPAAPGGMDAVGLDGAAYLRWSAGGSHVSRYLVYLTRLDGAAHLYGVGSTDGTGFLDERASNGHEFGYRVAAVDTLGHVSDLGPEITAVPRPDYTAELVYAFGDLPAQSGFRFQPEESVDPILPGSAAGAHWRLESGPGGYRIVPLNGAQVTEYGHTTALVCGPGADAECVSARVAPSSGYTTASLPAHAEVSYVFRIPGVDGPRFGVVRVSMLGQDQTGRDLMIFDWAYQTRANEPRLNVTGG